MAKQKDRKLNNFDMTLEECRAVFDTIDNLVIVDENGYLKYLSPDMFDMVEAYNKKPVPETVVGKHISEIHPATKILNALQEGNADELCFYFASDVTNIARIKAVRKHGKLIGAIDYDYFTDGLELKSFIDKLADYSQKGFINLDDTFASMLETSKKQRKIKYVVTDIIGRSPAIRSLRMQIGKIAESSSTVLVTGKTGCGKELVAHSIHNLSLRCRKAMVEVNCAAIPESLFESELFGYEEGAFTGAKKGGKKGLFEKADQSTIFLDEVDQLPYHVQPKLLRVLQEKEITPIGGTARPVDIRVIAATNKDLWKLVKEGKFREDLYYRLNVVELHIPPLCERKEDIPMLANYEISKLNKEMTKNIKSLSPEVMDIFMSYDWPGNVRELNNVLEYAMNVCMEDTIRQEHLGSFLLKVIGKQVEFNFDSDAPLEDIRSQAEKEAIKAALKITKNNRSKAAKLLKISRRALYDKISRYHLE